MPPELDAAEVETLRRAHYNATVTGVRRIHENLFILRVKPDAGIPPFAPGQYTSLGLGYWEPRAEPSQPERLTPSSVRRLAKRAYSIGSPIFAPGTSRLLEPEEEDFLEVFVSVVRFSPLEVEAPALTTRLTLLEPGDRLWVGPKFAGLYTLDRAHAGRDLLFCATGTGEAPHNRMIWNLLRDRFPGRIVNVTCARTSRELAYRGIHEELASRLPRYLYVPMTTREGGAARKRYVQDLIAGGELAERINERLDPARWDVFLCGNPAMIGVPTIEDGLRVHLKRRGAVEALETLGFEADHRRFRGNVHFETFW